MKIKFNHLCLINKKKKIMTNSFLSKYLKEWKDLPYNDYDLYRLFVYNDIRNLQANLCC